MNNSSFIFLSLLKVHQLASVMERVMVHMLTHQTQLNSSRVFLEVPHNAKTAHLDLFTKSLVENVFAPTNHAILPKLQRQLTEDKVQVFAHQPTSVVTRVMVHTLTPQTQLNSSHVFLEVPHNAKTAHLDLFTKRLVENVFMLMTHVVQLKLVRQLTEVKVQVPAHQPTSVVTKAMVHTLTPQTQLNSSHVFLEVPHNAKTAHLDLFTKRLVENVFMLMTHVAQLKLERQLTEVKVQVPAHQPTSVATRVMVHTLTPQTQLNSSHAFLEVPHNAKTAHLDLFTKRLVENVFMLMTHVVQLKLERQLTEVKVQVPAHQPTSVATRVMVHTLTHQTQLNSFHVFLEVPHNAKTAQLDLFTKRLVEDVFMLMTHVAQLKLEQQLMEDKVQAPAHQPTSVATRVMVHTLTHQTQLNSSHVSLEVPRNAKTAQLDLYSKTLVEDVFILMTHVVQLKLVRQLTEDKVQVPAHQPTSAVTKAMVHTLTHQTQVNSFHVFLDLPHNVKTAQLDLYSKTLVEDVFMLMTHVVQLKLEQQLTEDKDQVPAHQPTSAVTKVTVFMLTHQTQLNSSHAYLEVPHNAKTAQLDLYSKMVVDDAYIPMIHVAQLRLQQLMGDKVQM